MAFEQISFERDGSVGVIMLDRPERMNAWTPQMMEEMRRAISECNDDPSIGAVVVSGNGRAFCAGADIALFRQRLSARESGEKRAGSEAGPADAYQWVSFIRRSKPIVAAVNGVAVGVGVTQILPMDVRVCSERAKFGFFFVKMGLVPELASSALLPQLVGCGRAREWCLTGRFVLPEEARRSGLVTHVFAHEELLSAAKVVAADIAAHSRTSIMAIRGLLDENGFSHDLAAVAGREAEAMRRCYRSWEHKEAVAAFIEKRKPDFSPR